MCTFVKHLRKLLMRAVISMETWRSYCQRNYLFSEVIPPEEEKISKIDQKL
jgi:hypothetical protein